MARTIRRRFADLAGSLLLKIGGGVHQLYPAQALCAVVLRGYDAEQLDMFFWPLCGYWIRQLYNTGPRPENSFLRADAATR